MLFNVKFLEKTFYKTVFVLMLISGNFVELIMIKMSESMLLC